MDTDEKKLAEIERDERWLAAIMGPERHEEVPEKARHAARLAIQEEWLSGFTTPEPAPETIRRVKLAVRQALKRTDRSVVYRIAGAMSAAAVLVFAIGIGRFSVRAPATAPTALPVGENFVDAWTEVEQDGAVAALKADMAWLEQEINSLAGRPVRRSQELELESLQDRVDQLFAEPDDTAGTS